MIEHAPDSRPHRAHAGRGRRRGRGRRSRGRAPAVRSGPARRIAVRPVERLAPGQISVPGDFSSAAFLAVAAAIVPGSARAARGRRPEPDPRRPAGDPQPDGRGDRGRGGSLARRLGAAGGDRRPPRAARRHARPGRRGAAGDRRAAPGGAAGLLRRGPDRRLRGRGAASQGVGPDRDRGRGASRDRAPRSRRIDDGFAVRGTGGLRGGALDSHGDHRLAMLGAVAGLASRDGVEVAGADAAAVSYPRFEADLASLRRRGASAGWGGLGRARGRAAAAAARPRWPEPRAARWDRTPPAVPARRWRPRRRPVDLDRARDHQQPGSLVNLVLPQALPGRELDDDGAALVLGVEDRRTVCAARPASRCPSSASFLFPRSLRRGQLYPHPHGHSHRRPGGRGQVDGRSGRRARPRDHLSGLRSDVSLRRPGGAARRHHPRRRGGAGTARSRAGDRARRTAASCSNGEDVSEAIRAPEVAAAASRVSVHPEVREAIVERQRALIAAGDYVAEGRDIGTVVSPDASLKVFLTASDAERARRRAAETGEPPAEVLAAHATRDARDRGREHGALRAADDAVEIDTTGLEVDEVVRRIAALARERGCRAMSGRASPDRRGRLSQRRQVDARQPVGGRPGGGRPPRRRRDSRPQGARLRVERAPLPAGRYRWCRPGGRGLAVRGGAAPGARGDRRLRRGGAGRGRASRPAPRRRRGRRDPAPRRRSGGRGRQQDRRARRRLPGGRVQPARPG